MKFGSYVQATCRESSIHGLPYLVKRELHWSERLFWGAVILSATYFSVSICLNQWKRFRDNPIVYAVELTWGKRDFPYPGVTLCSDYINEANHEEYVARTWNVQRGDEKFDYYMDFLRALKALKFDNLDLLERFAKDQTLNQLNLKEALLAVNQDLIRIVTNSSQAKTKIGSYKGENHRHMYALALTEAGLCRTTSQLNEYTNSFDGTQNQEVSDVVYCGFMNECNTKILPNEDVDSAVRVFVHNVYDVVAPKERDTIMRESKVNGSLIMELLLGWTSADTEVRNVPIAYRKCRYPDENNLRYFKLYRPGLCRLECRINAALDMCKCKPFFYIPGPQKPICDIDGMLCLAKHNWSEVYCDCWPLCEEIRYTSTQVSYQKAEGGKFERTIIVKLALPRMAMKRRVVFSVDQMIMSFGGAIGLLLGASFISVYGLIYIFFEYVLANCHRCLGGGKRRLNTASNDGVRLVRPL